MKKMHLFILSISILSMASNAQTNGQLNLSLTTSEAGGNYAPRNILAVWIENENGEFVKTLLAYAQNRITHLNTWQASTLEAGTEFNVTDAITGATRNSHATRSCAWDATDYNQNHVPDGLYRVWMELTDKNGTGNFSSFEFTKGASPYNLSPPDVPSFSNISLTWQPSGVGFSYLNKANDFIIFNNPGNGRFELNSDNFDRVEVYSISGRFIKETTSKMIDISNESKGVYLIHIYKESDRTIKKVIIQ